MPDQRPSIFLAVDNAIDTVMAGDSRLALKGGGGGGTSDGMEARVAVLEAHVETVRKDVADLRKDMGEVKVQLATLTERVAHLPSKGFIVTASLAIMAFVAAVAAFQQQIQHLVHG